MTRGIDPMRAFAYALLSYQAEYARLDLRLGDVPTYAWLQARERQEQLTPWPGVYTGAGVVALGVLVLAIRRPAS